MSGCPDNHYGLDVIPWWWDEYEETEEPEDDPDLRPVSEKDKEDS